MRAKASSGWALKNLRQRGYADISSKKGKAPKDGNLHETTA
jgi:hypothetical protein